MDSVMSLGRAVCTLVNCNFSSMITISTEELALLQAYFPLQEAYTKLLAEKEAVYSADVIRSTDPAHPEYAAQAAADYQVYNMDSACMDKDTGQLNQMIQDGQSQVRQVNDANGNLFGIEQPLAELLKMSGAIILSFFRG